MSEQPRRAWWRVTAAAAVLALAGCSWRLETEPPVAPSPDAAESARDAAARAEADVQLALAALGDDAALSPGEEVLVAHERNASAVYAEVWGPVYVPFPDASPTASPSVTPDPPGLSAARADAQRVALANALAHDDPEVARVFAAQAVARAVVDTYAVRVDTAAVAEATGDEQPPIAAERPLVIDGDAWPLVPVETALSPAELERLIAAHDRAQYVYELIAGKSGGAERSRAAARGRAHRARAAALVELLGSDPRGAGYVIDLGTLADGDARDALARATEHELALTYLAAVAVGAADDRAWLMSGAHDALTQEAVWPGFDPGSLPVLPGHTPDSASERSP